MSFLLAAETESLLEALFLFFWGKSFDLYSINVHGIGVFGHSRERGEGLESLGGSSILLSDLVIMISLVLKMDCF